MPYLELDGIAHYYETHGEGAPVVLLHGGYCSIETWHAQIDSLSATYCVHAPERPGQGRTRDREGPITFPGMVADTLAYLDVRGLDSVHVVGFSDGGITGLLLAMEHPERVRSLVSISANLDPGGFADDDSRGSADMSGDDVDNSDAADPEDEAYARLSPDGPEHAEIVIKKLARLWEKEPQIDAVDLKSISAPTLIMSGDSDSITTEHTTLIARSIPGAQLCVVPGAGHMVLRDRPNVVNLVINEFLERQPLRATSTKGK